MMVFVVGSFATTKNYESESSSNSGKLSVSLDGAFSLRLSFLFFFCSFRLSFSLRALPESSNDYSS